VRDSDAVADGAGVSADGSGDATLATSLDTVGVVACPFDFVYVSPTVTAMPATTVAATNTRERERFACIWPCVLTNPSILVGPSLAGTRVDKRGFTLARSSSVIGTSISGVISQPLGKSFSMSASIAETLAYRALGSFWSARATTAATSGGTHGANS
jgi:hypothetical protein